MNSKMQPNNNHNFELLLNPPSTLCLIRRFLARFIDEFLIFVLNFSLMVLLLQLFIFYNPTCSNIIDFLSHLKKLNFLHFDISLYNVLFLDFLRLILSLIFFNVVNSFVLSLIMYYCGNSIGKALFGIKIINKDMSAPKLKTLFYREIMARGIGNAFKITILSIIANILAFTYTKKMKESYWDQQLNTKIIYKNIGILNWFIGIILILFISFTYHYMLLAIFIAINYTSSFL